MTIDPKDLKTLLVRVTLITLAVRAVPLLSSDLGPGEAAAAMGLGADGLSMEPIAQLWRAWLHAAGGVGLLVRLPALLADLSLPLLAILFARAAGWGALAGLVAGLVLAIAPLGIEAGFRADGGAIYAALALGALGLLQRGLAQCDLRWVVASALLLAAGLTLAAPLMLLVPVGMTIAQLALVERRVRLTAVGTWLGAAVVATLGRWLALGHLLPEATRTDHWLAQTALTSDGGTWASAAPLTAGLDALAAISPAGAAGAVAGQLQMPAAPLWALALAAVLCLLAGAGVALGRVQADPSPARVPAVSTEQGAGAADGWRTLGVGGMLNVPRQLGLRDWLPLALGAITVALDVALAAQRHDAAGLFARLAVGRVCVALLLGVGLTAWAMPRNGGSESENLRLRRRFNLTLALSSLAIFALGAAHLLAWTRSVDPLAPHRVAQFAREHMEDHGALLTVGPRGLAVAFLLDPLGNQARVRVASLEPADAKAHLAMLLRQGPAAVVLAGDRDALGETGQGQAPRPDLARLSESLRAMLEASGYRTLDDGHAYLGQTAVAAFTRAPAEVPDPASVRPQLGPGLAP